VTLEHLLLALTEDTEASLILQSANVDLARLSTDVSGYLGRLLEDMRAEPGVEPRPDPELLRVLQAAASAAQQSRRKQIDGAIVLAAIVGDGKSPAAGLLKALGMTFEEAIRALQRANTKARLKPLAKAPAAAGAAPQAPAPAPEAPPAETRAPDRGDDEPPTVAAPLRAPDTGAAEPAMPQPLVTQSADEILAAARARIQQRAAAKTPKTEPSIPHEAAPAPAPPAAPSRPAAAHDVDAQIAPVDPAQAKSLTAAIEAAMSSGARGKGAATPVTKPAPPRPSEPMEKGVASGAAPSPGPPSEWPTRPAWTPPPEPRRQPPGRAPQTPLARVPPPPFAARQVQPNEGPRRPPLPPRAVAGGQAQPGFPNRPARAPWPEAGDHGGGVRPPLANGSLAETAMPAQLALERADITAKGTGAAPRGGPAPKGGQTDRALLAESIPRSMSIGVPAVAEVRVAREKLEMLIAALNARGAPQQGDASLARALSVRLGGPKGDFWIEPNTPETHWADRAPEGSPHDDYITWRWTIFPRRRGRSRLTMVMSARSIGPDGIATQGMAPDRIIDVRVRPNRLRKAMRLFGWIAAAAAGAFIGRHSQEMWAPAVATVRKALALLGV